MSLFGRFLNVFIFAILNESIFVTRWAGEPLQINFYLRAQAQLLYTLVLYSPTLTRDTARMSG